MNSKYKEGWDRTFGVMPVRQDIAISPRPKTAKLGWTVSELIGIGIVNPRAIRRLSFKELLAQMTTEEEVRQFIVNESMNNPEGMAALHKAIEEHFPQYHKLLKLFSFA